MVTVVADESNNAYLINIIYIPDNDVKETNIEVYLERA
jgi:predicted nuclease of restriction endonuclease-like RecB superfamily